MSGSWNLFVVVGTILSILASFWLIMWSGRQGPGEEAQDTGHTWDGLTERNNPLPRWWLYLFVLTLIWGIGYLVFYPGLGNYAGVGQWSQLNQYDAEIQKAEQTYGPIFAQFAAMDPEELVNNADAQRIGKSLFSNYCTQCHGSLGYGATGFPNLADADWLYGSDFGAIEHSILNGRAGVMPALGAAFSNEAELKGLVDYVYNMSGGVDVESTAHKNYTTYCSACHGPNGQGMTIMGAPKLNDDIWLYGGSKEAIEYAIVNGRQGVMPAHKEFLGADRVRILAAYVAKLGQSQQ